MLVLPAELTHAQAPAALDLLQRAARAEAGERVCVDAAGVSHFDSSALAVLLALRRTCGLESKHLVVRGLPERLRSLADQYGISALLPDEATP